MPKDVNKASGVKVKAKANKPRSRPRPEICKAETKTTDPRQSQGQECEGKLSGKCHS